MSCNVKLMRCKYKLRAATYITLHSICNCITETLLMTLCSDITTGDTELERLLIVQVFLWNAADPNMRPAECLPDETLFTRCLMT